MLPNIQSANLNLSKSGSLNHHFNTSICTNICTWTWSPTPSKYWQSWQERYEDWNAKVGTDALKRWSTPCGPFCSEITSEQGLRLLDFASYNNLVLTNTLSIHNPSRCWTWHAPNGAHHNQIDYILVQNRFWSGINKLKTRTFPGADIGSGHDLVLLRFKVRLKKTSMTHHHTTRKCLQRSTYHNEKKKLRW